MKDSDSISVVIPYYNSQATIVRALDSVVSQTKKINEIILVNDGSTDNGEKVVDEYISINIEHNFKHISFENNRGQAKAKNAGVLASTSSFIAFLDADDSWNSKKTEIQTKYLIDNPRFKVITCKMAYLKDNKEKYINEELLTLKEIGFYNQIFRLTNLHSPGQLFEKQFFMQIGMYENMRFLEDLLLTIRATMFTRVLYIGGEPLAYVFKPFYGDTGLASNLLAVQKVELNIFKMLYREKSINIIIFFLASILSSIRFLRRVVITTLRNSHEKN